MLFLFHPCDFLFVAAGGLFDFFQVKEFFFVSGRRCRICLFYFSFKFQFSVFFPVAFSPLVCCRYSLLPIL